MNLVDFVNEHLAGKTIAKAWANRANPDACLVHSVIIECTDGSRFEITGEHDDGFEISAWTVTAEGAGGGAEGSGLPHQRRGE